MIRFDEQQVKGLAQGTQELKALHRVTASHDDKTLTVTMDLVVSGALGGLRMYSFDDALPDSVKTPRVRACVCASVCVSVSGVCACMVEACVFVGVCVFLNTHWEQLMHWCGRV